MGDAEDVTIPDGMWVRDKVERWKYWIIDCYGRARPYERLATTIGYPTDVVAELIRSGKKYGSETLREYLRRRRSVLFAMTRLRRWGGLRG